jgi:protein arginine kinase activator
MQCDECGKRPATVHITKIENGKKTDRHLCEQCAAENNGISFNTTFSINDILTGLMNPGGVLPFKMDVVKDVKCDVCGLSYNRFRETGRFGCSHCYKVFGDKLNPLFKKLHGNINHTGKIPNKAGGRMKVAKEIERLKQQLHTAVANEEYEKAAEIRDRIRELSVKEQGEA